MNPMDTDRLKRQYARIFSLMMDGRWRTLGQISGTTQDPPASVSAQLRHMRKPEFGSHTVGKRCLGRGLYEYQLQVNQMENA